MLANQLNMKIGAKIDILLKEKGFVIIDDLLVQSDRDTIKKAIIQYGMANPSKIVCSVLARQRQADKIIAGSYTMTNIIPLASSNQYEIEQLIPIGAVSQEYSVKQLIQMVSKQLVEKSGNIVYTKPKPRQYLIQSKKGMIKKPSQKNSNDEKEETKNVKNVKDFKKTKSNIQNTKQIQTKPKEVLKSSTSKKLLKIQCQNESSEDYIKKQYMIQPKFQPPIKSSSNDDKINQQAKQEQIDKIQEENQIKIEQKVADLELDDEEAYELLMAKQNKKSQHKAENKCTNIPEKLEKKVIEKTTNVNPSKPKPNITQQKLPGKMGGQKNLFAYMNKK